MAIVALIHVTTEFGQLALGRDLGGRSSVELEAVSEGLRKGLALSLSLFNLPPPAKILRKQFAQNIFV